MGRLPGTTTGNRPHPRHVMRHATSERTHVPINVSHIPAVADALPRHVVGDAHLIDGMGHERRDVVLEERPEPSVVPVRARHAGEDA